MIYFSASDSCHVTVQNKHLDEKHLCFAFDRESDVQAVPTGAGFLWRLIGLSVGGVCWWQRAPGGSFVTTIIERERGVNKFYIARITLLFDSVGGRDAVAALCVVPVRFTSGLLLLALRRTERLK